VPGWLRWLALAIGSLAAAFWLRILLDIVACDALAGYVCLSLENIVLPGIVAASVLSVLLAWRQAGAGSLALVGWEAAFTVFAYVNGGPRSGTAMLVFGVPFLAAGALLLVSWGLRQSALSQPPSALSGRR
jgi:hypothetical protein